MILLYDEGVRLLLKICILLLKAHRDTISIKEVDEISEKSFGIKLVAEKLLENNLAIPIQTTAIKLRYPQWFYEEMASEMDENKIVEKLRWDDEHDTEGVWLPYYRQKEIRNEIVNNSNAYKGVDTTEDKVICGISEKCIVLKDEKGEKSFHWFILPRNMALNPRYKNTYGNGFELAEEILKLHGDWENNRHLAYVLFDIEKHAKFFQTYDLEDKEFFQSLTYIGD